ncbi:Uncharacterized conserved protein [Mycolicibacterium fortuitum]|uniref:Uncharacterized conserved protein n=1 Tax=Mycolicibacterium fortuitum TaxID=1766 RepID=A0A378V507_MYCFO|nr:Uncharacterized conserved protein [Mycolicibacterium fortuitum]
MSEVAPERIHYRDSKSYFAILLDDNNRKPIIRLNLNGKSVKFVTTFEQGKDAGVRRDIASVVDIYKVATDHIRQTIRNYENASSRAAVKVDGSMIPVSGEQTPADDAGEAAEQRLVAADG